jgi:hypothetical protein
MLLSTRPATMKRVEIRIILERLEPPCGRVLVVADPSQPLHPRDQADLHFTGWLGLLKALYEVTGGAGGQPRPTA